MRAVPRAVQLAFRNTGRRSAGCDPESPRRFAARLAGSGEEAAGGSPRGAPAPGGLRRDSSRVARRDGNGGRGADDGSAIGDHDRASRNRRRSSLVSLAAQMRPGSRTYTRSAAVSVLLAIGAVGGIFPWHVSPAFVAQGLPCLASGILVAVAGAVVLRILVRRGAPVSARSIRVTLGAAAGWLALITLQYKCPHQEAPHLLAWHGGVLLLSAAAGLAWAREPRFRRDSRAA